MKLNYFFILVCLVGTMFLSGCGDDDAEDPTPPSSGDPKDDDPDTDPETSVTLTAEDFSVTIDENPDAGAVLGTIKAEVTEGTISYAISSQEKEEALSVDAETGEVTVLNPDRFDYDAYESLSAVVVVSAEGAEDVEIEIAVTLQDLDDQVGFITTWKITEEDKTVLIPINTDYDYDYTVNWGDGTTSRNHEGDAEHTYNEAGEYQIEVTGIFPAMNMDGSSEDYYHDNLEERLLYLDQWGNIQWENFSGMFAYCAKIQDRSEDTPSMTKVKSASKMFLYAEEFDADLSDWSVDNITNMSFMFTRASKFNGDLSKWDVSNVANMNSMFEYASSFNQDLSSWDLKSVSSMSYMLDGSGVSKDNYDKILFSWSKQDKSSIKLGASGLEFCDESARNALISKGWTISGDSKSADCN
ncbi:BspA family leucine-rich repeat surface protein [Fulvivirga ligni]|uniref:BspA family leucine-rich repeat surface protein n=1 Tax=Fulvivirga ligni TaxID=2904246 RepID=UPI001F3416B9|nr:BspA family leucine-rich repeat surface protein [Fulvivirga ligni]UII21736.1 BspA family leucine-rich repeat surface protein [Fulvivirga ligni]